MMTCVLLRKLPKLTGMLNTKKYCLKYQDMTSATQNLLLYLHSIQKHSTNLYTFLCYGYVL